MAGQLWAVSSLGGYYMSLNLSEELRMGVRATSKFRQFCDVKDAWGKVTRTGQTFTWDTVPMMTRASRALTETNTIPQGQHTVLQSTLTMNERGFSVPYTELLESLAKFSVKQPIMKVLKYDAMVDLDCLTHLEFQKTPLRFVTTNSADAVGALTTNSTATNTNSSNMSKVNLKRIVDVMKGRNIPRYEKEDYFGIARPAALRLLKNDLESLSQYSNDGFDMIMNGEIGRSAYENVRFVEQTVIPAGGAANDTTFDAFTDTGAAWTASGAGDWVFLFGEDTVCEAMHTPEEIRAKIPDDYGRSKGVAWYALLGYGMTHGSNATGVDSARAQARIVKFDSAV